MTWQAICAGPKRSENLISIKSTKVVEGMEVDEAVEEDQQAGAYTRPLLSST